MTQNKKKVITFVRTITMTITLPDPQVGMTHRQIREAFKNNPDLVADWRDASITESDLITLSRIHSWTWK